MTESVWYYFELYLSRADLRPASKDIKRQACRLFLGCFGRPEGDDKGKLDLPLNEVTPAMAEDFRRLLGAGVPAPPGKPPKPRSQITVNSYLGNFFPFWNWLNRHGYLAVNPFANVGLVEVDEQPPRETFTPQELVRIMMVATDVERLQVCFGLLGCRRGEMMAIQARDIHLEEPGYILLTRKNGTETTLPWGTKGRKARYIPLPPAMAFDGLLVPLKRLIEERIASLGGNPEGYLCVREERIATRLAGERTWAEIRDVDGNYTRCFRSLQRRAGLQHIRRFHELRAAFATVAIDQFGLSRAADLLGHASVETTRKYDRKGRFTLLADASRYVQSAYTSETGRR